MPKKAVPKKGRPPKGAWRTLTVKLPEHLMQEVERVAEEKRWTKTVVIEELVEKFAAKL